MRAVACRTACPHAEVGRLDSINKGWAMVCSRLMRDSIIPFWKSTWATGYCTSMPTVSHKSSNVLEVNSPALSTLMILIGWSGNCAFSRSMCARRRGKTIFRVDNRETRDHLDEAQMMAKKNRKGPLAGSIGPQTSACRRSKKVGILCSVLAGEGLVVSLPWEQAKHGFFMIVGCTVFGMPCVSLMSLWNMLMPGCPSLLCQISVSVLMFDSV